jgi:hypothetical protein
LLYVPLAWLDDQAIKLGVFWAARMYLYLPLSIFIWVDVFRRVTREEADQLLETMALAMVPLAGMYALSSVGVPIFPDTPYFLTFTGSAMIVRDFLTFPIWTRFALAYFLTRPRQTGTTLVSIGVLTACVVLSYTRSWIVPAGVVFAIAVFYTSVVRRRFVFAIPRLIGMTLIVVSAVGMLSYLFPNNLQYASDRVTELATQGLSTTNIVGRTSNFDQVNYYIQATGHPFGAGFAVQTAAEAITIANTYSIGDMLWTTLLLTLGYPGVILFGLLLVVFGIRAFFLMLDWRDAARARFGTILFMILAWDSIQVFATSGYVQLQQTSSALCFALVLVEARRLWAVNPLTRPRLPLLQGITLDWFSRDDEYWLYRRAALAVLLGFLIFQSVRFLVR